jgi:predicted short-subunit dehydrogenase-like oxidoreductase (DUF2520 family)
METLPPIAIVGRGRLGRWVLRRLRASGHPASSVGRGEPVPAAAAWVYLCVPDRALAQVAAEIPRGPILLHASGASSVDVLRPHAPAGVLHPLMTFPAAGPPSGPIPAAVDGDPPAREAARALAEALGWSAFPRPADAVLYHAAAVLAGNFASALLVFGAEVLAAAGHDRATARARLLPLARASLEAAAAGALSDALTGPLARGDHATVEAHLRALTALDPGLAQLYAAFGPPIEAALGRPRGSP